MSNGFCTMLHNSICLHFCVVFSTVLVYVPLIFQLFFDAENADSSVYGAVLTTDHKSRLCHVKWFSREGREMFEERDVSVYDITEHADFVFSAGDVVVRVASCKSDTESGAEGQDSQKTAPCVGQVR